MMATQGRRDRDRPKAAPHLPGPQAPVAAAAFARKLDVPVVAVIETSRLNLDQARAVSFTEGHQLTDSEPDMERAKKNAERSFAALGRLPAWASALGPGATGGKANSFTRTG